jgi:hypothetical protein
MQNTSLYLSIPNIENSASEKANASFNRISDVIRAEAANLDPNIKLTMEMISGESVAQKISYSRGVSDTHFGYGVFFLSFYLFTTLFIKISAWLLMKS